MSDRVEMKPFEFYITFTRSLFGALDKWFDSLGEKVGLSNSELKVLMFLSGKPSDDTAQWAATSLGISKALVSKVVEQLCRKGCIKQVQDTDDRRRYHLIIEPAARPILDSVNEGFVRSWEMISAGISDGELRAYLDVMARIIKNLSEGLGLDLPMPPLLSDGEQ